MQGSCMELALEGERLCKAGDCRTGVQFFESAIREGTDDLETLSAIYSQLGNAYFYLQEYNKALEYHKHDLNLARTLGDKLGEAKASGNLGNTLKVLGNFEEAIACCERHLDISRELGDKIGEARASYNLGNVYHAKGKHLGRCVQQDPGDFPPQVKDSLNKAAQYYEDNLAIVRELGDRAAQGRACGNLGNTHYLLGNFSQAITYHEERLAIAKEFGDKSAERRACSNLGNAHIFLGEFEVAADQYKETLQIANELLDKALEAQACYSLGNTYTLLRDYEKAIEYHVRHLNIAKELADKVGEGRACWSLGNAHSSIGNNELALQFTKRHLDISKELGDESGQATAQMNLADLKKLLGITSKSPDNIRADSTSDSDKTESDVGVRRLSRSSRRMSMENLDLMKLTPDKIKQAEAERINGGAKPKVPKVHRLEKAASVATDVMPEKPGKSIKDQMMDDESFFELISRTQSRRIDDQRCSFGVDGPVPITQRANQMRHQSENITGRPLKIGQVEQNDDFLDMVAGIQGSRMNDQRAALPTFPGLHNSKEVLNQLANKQEETTNLEDGFYEMLMKCQGSRIEDQRSTLPVVRSAPTVPDEDFFSLIQRVQSNRLDEQRSSMPAENSQPLIAGTGATGDNTKQPLLPSLSKKRRDKHEKENKKEFRK